jgi:MraZ protein
VFLGTYAPKLDDKGRVVLPAKFWDELAAGVVLAQGPDRCLFLYSQRGFEEVYAKLAASQATAQSVRDSRRIFLSSASQEAPDTQRRITIPSNLRDYAGLERDLTVIGVGDRVEIWDSGAWARYRERAESDFANLAEEVIPGLF